MFTLTFHNGKRQGQVLQFQQDRIVLGRAPDCDVIVPDEGVSRHHLELLVHEKRVWLRDLGSTKGTRIGEDIVETQPVSDGDRIVAGSIEFTLRIAELTGADELPLRERLGRLEDYRHLILRSPELAPLVVPVPHPGFRASGKWVKPGLPLRVRRLRIASALLALVCLLLLAGILTRQSENPTRVAATEVKLTPNQALTKRFGVGQVDTAVYGLCPRSDGLLDQNCGKLDLLFDRPDGLAVLTVDIGSIDTRRELEVLLNDKSLGFVPLAIKSWRIGYSVLLPTTALQDGVNRITLAHRKTAEDQVSWGVRNVHLRHYPAPPAVDLQKARQLMALGEERYRTRKVHPENLHAAAKAFREAALLVYREEPRPTLFERASERFAATDRELTVAFRREFMAALKELRFQKIDTACLILNQLAMRFPDKLDWRYAQTQAGLEAACEGN